jgi:hypothetical protein
MLLGDVEIPPPTPQANPFSTVAPLSDGLAAKLGVLISVAANDTINALMIAIDNTVVIFTVFIVIVEST